MKNLNRNLCFLLLGRNTVGIAADARKWLPVDIDQHDIVLVTREGDQLTPPEVGQVWTGPLSEFDLPLGQENIVVANGGTTAQLVAVLSRFAYARETATVYEVQQDGCTELGFFGGID